MNLGKLGVWTVTDTLPVERLAEVAQTIEQLGYAALWYPESRGHEAFSLASFLLSRTKTLIAATGIANIYARDSTTARQGQYTLAKLWNNRFLLGLGVSHVNLVEGVRGHVYGRPVATMRAYLDGMDKARDFAPKLAEPPPTVIAALGPRMIALGAKRTRGIHPYLVTPEHTAQARKIAGPDAWICTEQKVLLVNDAARARAAARKVVEPYTRQPNYRNNWLRLGFSDAEISAMSDRFIDAMVAWGDKGTIARRIQEHFDAGASHVCIQPLRIDSAPGPDMDALKALAP